jgi:hypothetical protein
VQTVNAKTNITTRWHQSRNLLLASIAPRLTDLRALLSPGTSVTITRDGISASIGNERFAISTGVEMEADLEAVCRLSERRVRG